MSGITKDEVLKAAKLASIGIADNEIKKLTQDLDSILHWMECIDNIDIPNELDTPSVENLKLERQDTQTAPDISIKLMSNAPESEHNFFVVPKVIEQ